MAEPKRILIGGFSDKQKQGGLETYVMSLYRHFDREKIQLDFIDTNKKRMAHAAEIHEMGGRIYRIPIVRDGVIAHYQGLHSVYTANHYIGASYQCNVKLKNPDFFKYAWKYHVPLRMIHSHNSTEDDPSLINRLREQYTDNQLSRYVNTFFACSEEAGRWMFGERPFHVVPNCIDTSEFSFQPERRSLIRRKYNLGDRFVIGTVGRLMDAKNPFYLLDIFSELRKINPEAVFLHIGEGELKEELIKRSHELHIEDRYHFIGATRHVADYMSAMDAFVLPSRHEGFPIVLVEAQSTGLPCFVADNVTKSCKLADEMYFIGIEEEPFVWAEKINQVKREQRHNQSQIIREAGYDIGQNALKMQNFLLRAAHGMNH